MLLISTTRFSELSVKGIDVSVFKLDKIFLLVTAGSSALLFINGYNYIDGIIFALMFITNFGLAILEMKREKTTIFESKVEISRTERQDAIRERQLQ